MKASKNKEKLAAMLREYGLLIEAQDIRHVEGYWKSQDVYRWTARCNNGTFDDHLPPLAALDAFLWDTIGRCVKEGINLVSEEIWLAGGMMRTGAIECRVGKLPE